MLDLFHKLKNAFASGLVAIFVGISGMNSGFAHSTSDAIENDKVQFLASIISDAGRWPNPTILNSQIESLNQLFFDLTDLQKSSGLTASPQSDGAEDALQFYIRLVELTREHLEATKERWRANNKSDVGFEFGWLFRRQLDFREELISMFREYLQRTSAFSINGTEQLDLFFQHLLPSVVSLPLDIMSRQQILELHKELSLEWKQLLVTVGWVVDNQDFTSRSYYLQLIGDYFSQLPFQNSFALDLTNFIIQDHPNWMMDSRIFYFATDLISRRHPLLTPPSHPTFFDEAWPGMEDLTLNNVIESWTPHYSTDFLSMPDELDLEATYESLMKLLAVPRHSFEERHSVDLSRRIHSQLVSNQMMEVFAEGLSDESTFLDSYKDTIINLSGLENPTSKGLFQRLSTNVTNLSFYDELINRWGEEQNDSVSNYHMVLSFVASRLRNIISGNPDTPLILFPQSTLAGTKIPRGFSSYDIFNGVAHALVNNNNHLTEVDWTFDYLVYGAIDPITHPKVKEVYLKILSLIVPIYDSHQLIGLSSMDLFAEHLHYLALHQPQSPFASNLAEYIFRQATWPELTRIEAYNYLVSQKSISPSENILYMRLSERAIEDSNAEVDSVRKAYSNSRITSARLRFISNIDSLSSGENFDPARGVNTTCAATLTNQSPELQ